MKMIKSIGVILAIILMIGFNSKVFAMDYDTLTTEQKASIEAAAVIAGEPNARVHYEKTITDELAKVDAKVRRTRERNIIRSLSDVTDNQLMQIEAILNP